MEKMSTNVSISEEAAIANETNGMAKKVKVSKQSALKNGNGHGPAKNGSSTAVKPVKFKDENDPEGLDAQRLLNALMEIKHGNFNIKMPVDKTGVNGKICDTLNDIIFINRRLNQEFIRAQTSIGKEGKLN